MRKHRRKTRHRHMAIAAVALSALAVPTAAMACFDDPSAEAAPSSPGQWGQWKNAASKERWKGGERTAPPASQAPAPPASEDPAPPAPEAPAQPASPEAAEPDAPAASPGTDGAAAPASGAVASIVNLVNSERGKAGCSPVKLNAKLSKAAQDHSADMAAQRNMSHTGSDGSDPGERITRAGYQWQTYGENVAYGYSSPEQVMAGWMSSPGHKRNILNCAFKEIGVGLAQPGNYWTQNFGTAR
ncbi:CAP domain-containing protein [Streptomyces cadmiisoli]|uniref:CAP domain-containing protein n=2 Tax=Streptomyces cadmiisoli TaxID=2184053 RepID=A0A2Z4ISM5_9ACTN|nr:CAP domain-containing protein [Streptomyces cadmiisoli]AWW36121.1 CAP domain-containing protein [Streptomyces cadmiisoli]